MSDRVLNKCATGVLNIISEHFIEAANATSIDAPYGVSEWKLTGLHPAPCTFVKASRVKESIFATECKLMEVKEFESRAKPGAKSGALAILEGVNFWVREDAINEEKSVIDPNVSGRHSGSAIVSPRLTYRTITDLAANESSRWHQLQSIDRRRRDSSTAI